eukprot:UN02553
MKSCDRWGGSLRTSFGTSIMSCRPRNSRFREAAETRRF